MEPLPLATRGAARRAVTGTLVTTVAFAAFAIATTQIPEVRSRSPWASDPWDAVVSFTIQLVGVVAVVTWVRCRAYRRRTIDGAGLRRILRGCDIVLAAIGLTVAVDLVGVAAGARPASSGTGPGWLTLAVVALGIATAASTPWLLVAWRRLGRREPLGARPERDPVGETAGWLLRLLPHPLEHHPSLAVALGALGIGLAFSLWHTVVEGVLANGFPAAVVVTGTYALIEAVGVLVLGLAALRYLRILPPDAHPHRGTA